MIEIISPGYGYVASALFAIDLQAAITSEVIKGVSAE